MTHEIYISANGTQATHTHTYDKCEATINLTHRNPVGKTHITHIEIDETIYAKNTGYLLRTRMDIIIISE